MVVSGWRAALIVLAAIVLVGLVLTALFWLAVIFAVLLAVLGLNLVVLPRIAHRTRIPTVVLGLIFLIALVGGGYLLGGIPGAVEGIVIWLLGVAAPRVVLWRLRQRMRLRSAPIWGDEIVTSSPTFKNRSLGRDPSG
jgi:hypothetical protein